MTTTTESRRRAGETSSGARARPDHARGMLLRGTPRDGSLLPLCVTDPESEAAARSGIEPRHWRLIIDHERKPASDAEESEDQRVTTAALALVDPGVRSRHPPEPAVVHTLVQATVTCDERKFARTEQAGAAVDALRDAVAGHDGTTPTASGTVELDETHLRKLSGAIAAAWHGRKRDAARYRSPPGLRRRYLAKTVRSLACKDGFDVDGEGRCIGPGDFSGEHPELTAAGVPPCIVVAIENTRLRERCDVEVLRTGDLVIELPGEPPGNRTDADRASTGTAGERRTDPDRMVVIVRADGTIARVLNVGRHRY